MSVKKPLGYHIAALELKAVSLGVFFQNTHRNSILIF
jgi:hypothetical protein